MSLLELKDLTIHYFTDEGVVKAVNGLSLSVRAGETVGLVGETGAGKTTTALGIMNLVPNPPGKIVSGQILYNGEDLTEKNQIEMRDIRGRQISMIFQDPMTALNPVLTVGDQIAEVIRLHEEISRSDAYIKAAEMLEMVGIPAERLGEYPHQFSGGMKQRVVIAIALACNPKLLIADEPTTALDVTIQAQVLRMMNDLKSKNGTAVLLITHDLGVIAEMCQRVAVIYSGEIVEMGTAEDLFDRTAHPYTMGLFDSLPRVSSGDRLIPIPGMMPDPSNLPKGCKFAERCKYATDVCREQEVDLTEIEPGHYCRCIHKLTKEG